MLASGQHRGLGSRPRPERTVTRHGHANLDTFRYFGTYIEQYRVSAHGSDLANVLRLQREAIEATQRYWTSEADRTTKRSVNRGDAPDASGHTA